MTSKTPKNIPQPTTGFRKAVIGGSPLLRPDIAEVSERWDAYWNGDSTRPLVWAYCLKNGEESAKRINVLDPGYPMRPDQDLRTVASNVAEMITTCVDCVGDEVPAFTPSFGPDQFSAFLGVKIEYSKDSAQTSWSVPFGKELADILPIEVDAENYMYRRMQDFFAELAAAANGRFLIDCLDSHSNLDALAAMRGPENICVDMYDNPDLVHAAMNQVVEAFKVFYNRFYEVGNMSATGTSSWMPSYCSGRYLCLASDFICLLSPSQAREFVIPALEAEASILDHAMFHLDGPDAVKHLDDILSIDKIRGIQWQPGAGRPQNGPEWLDLYKRILSKGKSLFISADTEVIKNLHKELRNPNVVYHVWFDSRRKAEELIDWLAKN